MDVSNTDFMARFQLFARANGIPLDFREDWLPWWECFCAGIDAGTEFGFDTFGRRVLKKMEEEETLRDMTKAVGGDPSAPKPQGVIQAGEIK